MIRGRRAPGCGAYPGSARPAQPHLHSRHALCMRHDPYASKRAVSGAAGVHSFPGGRTASKHSAACQAVRSPDRSCVRAAPWKAQARCPEATPFPSGQQTAHDSLQRGRPSRGRQGVCKADQHLVGSYCECLSENCSSCGCQSTSFVRRLCPCYMGSEGREKGFSLSGAKFLWDVTIVTCCATGVCSGRPEYSSDHRLSHRNRISPDKKLAVWRRPRGQA